jgi:uncharacterized phage protein (TIGR02218 family)
VTYATFESSTESARPIELYTITSGATIYYYTSTEEDQVVSGTTYDAIAISRDELKEGPEERDATFTITLPASLPFVSQWATGAPADLSTVKVERYHVGDNDVVTLFQGAVKAVNFNDQAGRVAQIVCEPTIAGSQRPLPRYTFSGQCNHVLYDDQCKVDDTDPAYRATLTVTAASGLEVTVPGLSSFTDGWFDSGVIEVGTEARMIIAHVGNVLTLHLPFNSSPVGASGVVLAGCAHDVDTCAVKFANVPNFGGFAFVPFINIFEAGIEAAMCN